MLNFLKFATAMVLLAGWGLAALSLHVVRTSNNVHLIPKNQLSLADTYVDVRTWTSDDEDKHHALFVRLKQLDQTNLLEAAATDPTPEAAPEKAAVASADSSGISQAWYRVNHARR